MDAERIALLAAFATAAAAVFAGIQIAMAAKAQRRNSTFDHLRYVDSTLQPVWKLNLPQVVEQIANAYEHGSHGLPNDAATYMAFLNALELLALGIEEGTVDAPIADDYLRTLCQSGAVDIRVIAAIRKGTRNERIYRCIGNKLSQFREHPNDRVSPQESAAT